MRDDQGLIDRAMWPLAPTDIELPLGWRLHGDAFVRTCPGCGVYVGEQALFDLVDAYEVCTCVLERDVHVVQRLWHRSCLSQRDGRSRTTINEVSSAPGPWWRPPRGANRGRIRMGMAFKTFAHLLFELKLVAYRGADVQAALDDYLASASRATLHDLANDLDDLPRFFRTEAELDEVLLDVFELDYVSADPALSPTAWHQQLVELVRRSRHVRPRRQQ